MNFLILSKVNLVTLSEPRGFEHFVSISKGQKRMMSSQLERHFILPYRFIAHTWDEQEEISSSRV